MMRIGQCVFKNLFKCRNIDLPGSCFFDCGIFCGRFEPLFLCGKFSPESVIQDLFESMRHLRDTVVSAGLQDRGRKCDRPYACFIQIHYIKRISSAGETDLQFAVEISGELEGHRKRQRVKRTAGHVHLVAGQLRAFYIYREGIGDLYAEFQSEAVSERLQTLQHGNRFFILKVVFKMETTELNISVSHIIKSLTGIIITEQGRIELDKSIELLLGQQISCDLFNIFCRTAVKCG